MSRRRETHAGRMLVIHTFGVFPFRRFESRAAPPRLTLLSTNATRQLEKTENLAVDGPTCGPTSSLLARGTRISGEQPKP